MDTLSDKGALECNLYESNVSIGSAHHGNGILDQSQLTMQQQGGMSASHEYKLRIGTVFLHSRDHAQISLLEKAMKN